ncbi:hypothetical protein KJZ71_02215 [Patescibacteria group bacterium]|jgi:glycosyltransferase involved in cell wall biosynthesis|nr:hypothetical protein [Patescibacteria group bacterium]MDL1952744.1 glycosyltransferase family 4 protein [Candidatus Uhrbacteria bacterium UHB]RIL01128.1 MAG: hypothetical protein DCC77_01130 [Candidatus Uhrbacteria bacterium]
MKKQRTLLICVETVDLDDRAYGFFNDWLLELERQNIKAIVICLRKGRMSAFAQHEIITLPRPGAFLALRRLFELWRISWDRRHEYSAVFVRQAPVFVMASGWLWRLLGMRIILWYAHYKGRWDLNIAACIAHVVVTSVPEACRIWSRKAIAIGQSIDTDRFRIPATKAHNGFRALVLGRVSPVKRVDEIIDVFETSAFKTMHGSLTIIGKATDRAYEKKILELVGEHAGIRWMREGLPFDALPSELSKYDFLMNFYEGSLDKAILECMACGIIPLISTDAAENFFPESLHWLIARTKGARLSAIEKLSGFSFADRQKISSQLRDIVVHEHSLSHQVHRLMEIANQR